MDKNKYTELYDVVVIGGGASGMMSAIIAARNGARVVLIEKNKRLGEKLRITGGGRCNITNTEANIRTYLKHYGKAEQYLYSAFSQFGVEDTIDFFSELKLPIKVEARNRAFPQSEKAVDVVHVLQNAMHRCGVEVRTGTTVKSFRSAGGTIDAMVTDSGELRGRTYILSTGGTSRPETGSTGDGFSWLKELGQIVREPTPSITPLSTYEKWVEKVSGSSAKGVNIVFFSNDQRAFKLHGDVLFTHFGVSGPLILNNAYRVAELLEQGSVSMYIDCLPKIDEKQFDANVIEILRSNGAKKLQNVLNLFVPHGLSPAVKDILYDRIDFDLKSADVSKEQRKLLVQTIKALPLTIEKLMGFEKAVVADGGLSLDDIDMRTMRSKKISNLYVTGDLLDINRPSGGFSLQLCWTTGYIAGREASILD